MCQQVVNPTRENLPKCRTESAHVTPAESRIFVVLTSKVNQDFRSLARPLCASPIRPRSLIKTILAGSGKLAQGNELETVGVEISDYTLAGKSTKFYDLAGQVDYYGLHQLFMTERALYVMTWDASKFLRRKEVTPHDIENIEEDKKVAYFRLV